LGTSGSVREEGRGKGRGKAKTQAERSKQNWENVNWQIDKMK
jgi:hypothetical protein